MNEIRNIHKKITFKCSDVCKRCYLPRLTEKEYAYVNNRKIVIEKLFITLSKNRDIEVIKCYRILIIKAYIIAEIGGNFIDYETGKKLIDLAIKCEVDAVKLQTYKADTISSTEAIFDMENTGIVSQHDLFKKYEINEKCHKDYFEYAKKER